MAKFSTEDERYVWMSDLETALERASGNNMQVRVLEPKFMNNIRFIDLTEYNENTIVNGELFKTSSLLSGNGTNLEKIDNMYDMADIGDLFIMVPVNEQAENSEGEKQKFAICQVTLDDNNNPVVSDINKLEFAELPSKAQRFWMALKDLVRAIGEFLFVNKEERERRAEAREKYDKWDLVDSALKKFVEGNVSTETLEADAKKNYDNVAHDRESEYDVFDKPVHEDSINNYINDKVGRLTHYFDQYFVYKRTQPEGTTADSYRNYIKRDLLKPDEREMLIKYYNNLRDAFGEEYGRMLDKFIKSEDLEEGMDENRKRNTRDEINKITYESLKSSDYLLSVRSKAMQRTLYSGTVVEALGINDLKEYLRGEMKGTGKKYYEKKRNEMKGSRKNEFLEKISNYAAYGNKKEDQLDLIEMVISVCAMGEYAGKYGCGMEIETKRFENAACDVLPKVESAVISYLDCGNKKELYDLMADSLSVFGKKMMEIGNNEDMAFVYAEGMNQTLMQCSEKMGDEFNEVIKGIKDFPKIKAYTGIVNDDGRGYNAISSVVRMATDGETKLNSEKQLGKSVTELIFRGEISRRILNQENENLNKFLDKLAQKPEYLDETIEKLKQTNSFKRFSQLKPAEMLKITSTPDAMNKVYAKAMGELKKMEEVHNENSKEKKSENVRKNEQIVPGL